MEKIDLKNLTLIQMREWVKAQGWPAFRAQQIFAWLYRTGISEFSQMTDISKEVRAKLAQIATISRLTPAMEERSEDGSVKYGFRLADGAVIESVLIPEGDRLTLCVSSQVGCAMGCNFCLTGTMGFVRNLSASEIVGQVQAITEIVQALGRNRGTNHGVSPKRSNNHGTSGHRVPQVAASGLAMRTFVREPDRSPQDVVPCGRLRNRINNLVFMGMGEPLANFDNLIDGLNILMEQTGLDFSSRRITVSTCGIIPKLKALGEAVTVNLAISLHAADDETRSQLMPINQTYPVDELLAACRAYPLPSRRKVMIEYIMIKDLNDSVRHARLLIKKLHKLRCKVNLLPYNENKTFPYQSPDRERLELFQQTLRDSGITALIRDSRGGDISAACGQLAAEADEEE